MNTDTIAIHEDSKSDKVVEFKKVTDFNETIQKLIENGELWGIFLDEQGRYAAWSKSETYYENILT